MERSPGFNPLLRNLILIGTISLFVASVLLGISSFAEGTQTAMGEKDGPARAAAAQEEIDPNQEL